MLDININVTFEYKCGFRQRLENWGSVLVRRVSAMEGALIAASPAVATPVQLNNGHDSYRCLFKVYLLLLSLCLSRHRDTRHCENYNENKGHKSFTNHIQISLSVKVLQASVH